MEQAEPYYVAGMRMMEEEVAVQGRNEAWDGGTAGHGGGSGWSARTDGHVATNGGNVEGMDVDMS